MLTWFVKPAGDEEAAPSLVSPLFTTASLDEVDSWAALTCECAALCQLTWLILALKKIKKESNAF